MGIFNPMGDDWFVRHASHMTGNEIDFIQRRKEEICCPTIAKIHGRNLQSKRVMLDKEDGESEVYKPVTFFHNILKDLTSTALDVPCISKQLKL